MSKMNPELELLISEINNEINFSKLNNEIFWCSIDFVSKIFEVYKNKENRKKLRCYFKDNDLMLVKDTHRSINYLIVCSNSKYLRANCGFDFLSTVHIMPLSVLLKEFSYQQQEKIKQRTPGLYFIDFLIHNQRYV